MSEVIENLLNDWNFTTAIKELTSEIEETNNPIWKFCLENAKKIVGEQKDYYTEYLKKEKPHLYKDIVDTLKKVKKNLEIEGLSLGVIIKIDVKYFSSLGDEVGIKEEEFIIKNGAVLDDLVEKIKYKYQNRNLRFDNKFYIAYIERQNLPGQIFLLDKRKEVKLNNSDKVSFMIAIAGG